MHVHIYIYIYFVGLFECVLSVFVNDKLKKAFIPTKEPYISSDKPYISTKPPIFPQKRYSWICRAFSKL